MRSWEQPETDQQLEQRQNLVVIFQQKPKEKLSKMQTCQILGLLFLSHALSVPFHISHSRRQKLDLIQRRNHPS